MRAQYPLLMAPPPPFSVRCITESRIELMESGIGSGLCWLFQNLTSWPPPIGFFALSGMERIRTLHCFNSTLDVGAFTGLRHLLVHHAAGFDFAPLRGLAHHLHTLEILNCIHSEGLASDSADEPTGVSS